MRSIEEIKKINSFSEIKLPESNEGTLFLLDIDDTIFTSISSWGSVKFFHWMVEDACAHGYNLEHAKVLVYPRWLDSQSVILTKLVDPTFPNFLEKITSTAYVMGLTARQAYINKEPVIAEITAAQLEKLKIEIKGFDGLEFNKKYEKPLHSDKELSGALNLFDDCQAIYHKGVLFTHDLNKKGEVFRDFFDTALSKYCQINKMPLPNKVIFVDDGGHNLESMYDTCTAMGLAYEGYHLQSTGYYFNADNAKLEEAASVQRSRSFSDFGKLSGASISR